MSYTWERVAYGVEPHQWMEVGRPSSQAVGSKLRCFVYLPGGGWGLRDKRTLDHPTIGTALFRAAYNNPNSSHYETSVVVYVNVASNTYNGMSNFRVFPWDNGRHLFDVGDWVSDAGSVPYECIAAHEPDKNEVPGHAFEGSEPNVGANWQTFWAVRTRIQSSQAGRGQCAHVVGTTWSADETARGSDGRQYICKQSHTTTTITDPATGASSADYWEMLQSHDIVTPRIGGMGDMTTYHGIAAPRDLQMATQFLRKNARRFDIFPSKITHAGESAGGHGVALCNALEDHSFAHKNQAESTQLYTPSDSGRANAQIPSYFPTHLENYFTVDLGATGLGIFGVWMKSLFGNSDLQTFDGWSSWDSTYKESLDVIGATKATGLTIPTFLSFSDIGSIFDPPEAEVYGNVAGKAFNMHHAINGWKLFELFRSPITSGGFEQNQSVFLCRDAPGAAATAYQVHTEFNAAGGILGTTYTDIPLTADALGEAHANWIVSVLP